MWSSRPLDYGLLTRCLQNRRGEEERVSQSKLFIYNLGIIDKQTNGQMPRWDNYHLNTLKVSNADVKILTKNSSTAQGAQKRLCDKSSSTVSVRNERDLRRDRERKGDHLSDHRLDAKAPSIKDFDQDVRTVLGRSFRQEVLSSPFYLWRQASGRCDAFSSSRSRQRIFPISGDYYYDSDKVPMPGTGSRGSRSSSRLSTQIETGAERLERECTCYRDSSSVFYTPILCTRHAYITPLYSMLLSRHVLSVHLCTLNSVFREYSLVDLWISLCQHS
jgi:hypothetical protein